MYFPFFFFLIQTDSKPGRIHDQKRDEASRLGWSPPWSMVILRERTRLSVGKGDDVSGWPGLVKATE